MHVGWYAASFRFSVVSFQVFATARGWLVLNVEWKGHSAEWGRRGFRVQGLAISYQLSANGRVRPGRTNLRAASEWCVKGRTRHGSELLGASMSGMSDGVK